MFSSRGMYNGHIVCHFFCTQNAFRSKFDCGTEQLNRVRYTRSVVKILNATAVDGCKCSPNVAMSATSKSVVYCIETGISMKVLSFLHIVDFLAATLATLIRNIQTVSSGQSDMHTYRSILREGGCRVLRVPNTTTDYNG